MEKWAVGAAVAVGLLLGSGTLHAHGDEVHAEVPKVANGGQVQRAGVNFLELVVVKNSKKVGDNPVDRLLGKELCVLAWAVEQMEMEKIPVAVRNWLALRPEERWWLFGMTAMSTGGVMDAGKGWRVALKHALGDVAQSELLAPRAKRGKPEQEVAQASLGLFGDEAP